MKPNTLTVFQLFEAERRFIIPLFQRPYVWSQERQWKPLWEDIATKSDQVLSYEQQSHSKPRQHFLGAIVLGKVATYGREVTALGVIDGQQRLTTIQIVLIALRDYVVSLDDSYYLQMINKITYNSIAENYGAQKYKVWPTNADRVVFEDIYNAKSPDQLLQKYPRERKKFTKQFLPRPSLVEAYFYFYDSIEKYVQGQDELFQNSTETAQSRLDAMVKALTENLEIVTIELEDDDDPQVIFETLNARGEPLLPSDLIRNFVFLEAERQGKERVDDLYDSHWRPFDENDEKNDNFWKTKVPQGRISRPRLDLFFFHYLSYRIEHDVLITNVFQEFRNWWTKEHLNVEAELQNIRVYSVLFRSLFDSDQVGYFSVFARRLRLLDTSTVYPFLLFLLGAHKDNISISDRDAILRDVESYLIRRMVCGLTTKNYNHVFPQLLRQMKKSESIDHATVRRYFSELKDAHIPSSNLEIRTKVRRYFADLQGESVRWPTDEEFRDAWLSFPVYDKLTVRRVMMVLEALDLQLITSKQEQIHLDNDLSIEHILPQKGTLGDWPLPAEPSWGESPLEYRDRMMHTFGNLTLLTQKLNSSISNGPFNKKRPEITKNSSLRINTYLQEYEGKPWTEDEILERGKSLFELAKVIWPGPDPIV